MHFLIFNFSEAKMEWKWWKIREIREINFVLTRKYTNLLEHTRMCTNMWFLVSDCVFYWFFAKVERVWSESEVKWSEFVLSQFTRINYNLLELNIIDSKGAQIWYEVKMIIRGYQFVSRVKINWVLIWSENFHHS